MTAQTPVPDDELLSAQLARLDRRAEAAEAERRRLADLYQAGVIGAADMTRRAAELDSRRRRIDDERQALVAQRAELAEHNRLSQRIEAFAARALAGLDGLDFQGRQQLLRLVLEDVRVQGWQVELRLRIPSTSIHPTTRPCRRRRCRARASGAGRRETPAARKRGCQAMTVCVPLVNICEQCDNFVTTTKFLPQLQAQLADVKTLRDDAQARGWDTEVARHARVIASIDSHIRRLQQQDNPVPDA